MSDSPTPNEQPPQLPASNGKAIASLVLGITSFPLSIFVIGIFTGIAGIILGIIHITTAKTAKAMAWWGTVLSAIASILSIVVLIGYFQFAQMIFGIIEEGYYYEEENLDQWVGVIAPDITVTTMNGDTIKLSEAKGKRVILDIWATWCPPCIKEIPHFNTLRNEIPEDELLIVGITDEDQQTVRDFMEDTVIDYHIAAEVNIDDLPEPYSAISAYPTTFIIDSKGVIQNIVVGYEDLEALREYATAPDFQGEPLTEPAVPTSTLVESENMLTPTNVWNLNIHNAKAMSVGDWDQDGIQDVLITDSNKQLHIINNQGIKSATIPIPGIFDVIEFGFHATDGPRLLGTSIMRNSITVINKDGKKLWSYTAMLGINGAHWGDFDGDGTDEMLVGMNGFGGLHGVSDQGKKLWKNNLGNVWNQSVIPAKNGRDALLLATEAGGTIRLFESSGEEIRTLRPGGAYYTTIFAAEVDAEGTRQILAIGEGDVVACDVLGNIQWTTTVGKEYDNWTSTTFAVGDIDGDGTKEWAFHDVGGEFVIVTTTGEKKASLSPASKLNEFAILPMPDKTGLLITLQSDQIKAYKFTAIETDLPEEQSIK